MFVLHWWTDIREKRLFYRKQSNETTRTVLVGLWTGEAISMLLNHLFLERGGFSCIPKRKVFPFLFLPMPSSVPLHCIVKLLLTNFLVLWYLQVYIYTLQTPVKSQGYHTCTLNMLVLLCNSAGVRVRLIERIYIVLGWEISNPGETKRKTTWLSALTELQKHWFS